MLRLFEFGGDVKVIISGKRKKYFGLCFDLKCKDIVCNDSVRSRGNEVLILFFDFNDNILVVSSKVLGFDLNLVLVKLK